MIVLYIMSNGTPQENLKQIFRVFDINNDGFISLKELQRIVKDLFHLINEENADEASQELLAQSGCYTTFICLPHPPSNSSTKFVVAFNEMDENHDGQVSEEEFIEVDQSYDVLFLNFTPTYILGLHESEKVFNDADIKNHRCFRDFRMTSSLRVSYNAHTTT